jgi:hypothetical protein
MKTSWDKPLLPGTMRLNTADYSLPVMHVRPSGQQLEEDSSRAQHILLRTIIFTAIVLRALHVGGGVHVLGQTEVRQKRVSFEVFEGDTADMDVTEG